MIGSRKENIKFFVFRIWNQHGVAYYGLRNPNEIVSADDYRRQLNKLNGVLFPERPAIESKTATTRIE